MGFKILLKKIKNQGKKNVSLIFFMVLPLILLSGITINFFNLYFESFENYHAQHIGYDFKVFIYSNQTNYGILNSSLHNELKNTPYKGFVVQTSPNMGDKEFNLTISDPNLNVAKYYNRSIILNGVNFSGRDFRSFFLNKSITLTSGNLPKNENETIAPTRIQQAFNLTLNSTINFYSYNTTDFNATVVGFYESVGKPQYYKYFISGEFLFFFNDGQLTQKFSELSYTEYQIYLDHKQMDVFNSNALITEINEIEIKIRNIFSNYTSPDDIFSSQSKFFMGNSEYFEYLSQVYSNFFYLVGPIFVFLLIFSYLFSKYNARSEHDTWNKIMVFKSSKYVKIHLFFDLLLNNLLSYVISIPIGIILYFTIGNIFNQSGTSNLEIYLPLPFLMFTFAFNVIYLLSTYLFSLSEIPVELDLTKKHLDVETPLSSKKVKNIAIVVLIVISLLPILVFFLYYIELFFYNPIINQLYSFLKNFFVFLQSYYVVIILTAILMIFPGLIIKLFPLLNKIAFLKFKAKKTRLLKQFFTYNRKSLIVFIVIVSLGIGFINFYQIDRINQSKQKELEIYLKIGSDFKLYEPYLYGNNTNLNASLYFNDTEYCQIQSIAGKFTNYSIIFPQVFSTITVDPIQYYLTLNNYSKNIVEQSFLSRVEGLKIDEILLPTYLQVRYGLKENEFLTFQPQNTTTFRYNLEKQLESHEIIDNEIEFLKNYEINFKIKGFFNFLPGLDQDEKLFSATYPYSDGGLLITSPNFNYSKVFNATEVKNTYLIREYNNTESTIKNLVREINGDFASLNEELFSHNISLTKTMNNTMYTVFGIFVVIFFFMNILFIVRFVRENDETWNLLQLWGIPETRVKKMIFWGLLGIFLISFLLGLIGILGAFLILVANNMEFKNHLYLYPIQFHLDPTGILFNLFYLIGSLVMAWLFTTMVINVRLNYTKIKNYYIE